jgi:predicted transposase YbfD/YdcC
LAIENKLRWVVDIGLSEDLDRKRASHATQNFSLLNRITLTCSNRKKAPAKL